MIWRLAISCCEADVIFLKLIQLLPLCDLLNFKLSLTYILNLIYLHENSSTKMNDRLLFALDVYTQPFVIHVFGDKIVFYFLHVIIHCLYQEMHE